MILVHLSLLALMSGLSSGAVGAPASQDVVSRITEVVKKTRDPFQRIRRGGMADVQVSDLERFPAENFRLTGVVSGIGRVKAMLVAPNSKTYFVSENMKIGVRKGVITRITPEEVVVRERVVSPLGDEESVDLVIRLMDKSSAGGKNN